MATRGSVLPRVVMTSWKRIGAHRWPWRLYLQGHGLTWDQLAGTYEVCKYAHVQSCPASEWRSGASCSQKRLALCFVGWVWRRAFLNSLVVLDSGMLDRSFPGTPGIIHFYIFVHLLPSWSHHLSQHTSWWSASSSHGTSVHRDAWYDAVSWCPRDWCTGMVWTGYGLHSRGHHWSVSSSVSSVFPWWAGSLSWKLALLSVCTHIHAYLVTYLACAKYVDTLNIVKMSNSSWGQGLKSFT